MTENANPTEELDDATLEAMLGRMRRYAEIIARDSTPDGEKAMFALRLEGLRQKYAIDEAALLESAATRIEPITRRGIYIAPSGHPIGYDLARLAVAVAEHYGIKIHFNSLLSRKEEIYGINLEATAFGFERDLLMWEAAFTGLHAHMMERLSPVVSATPENLPENVTPFDFNVYRMHRAGLTWPQMVDPLNLFARRNSEAIQGQKWPYPVLPRDGKLKRAAMRVYKELGEPYHPHKDPATYRKSFADGYVTRIAARLYEARSQVSTTGSELVLVSKFDLVKKAYAEKWDLSGAVATDAHATKKMDVDGMYDGMRAADSAKISTESSPAAKSTEIAS